MKKFILILGGARSGKSRYAIELAKKMKGKILFIATAASRDREMKQRIKLHKASRPKHWKLIEEEEDIGSIIWKRKSKYKVILIDCLGLLISNLLGSNLKDKEIEIKIKQLTDTILKTNTTIIAVSNEVGTGVVPNNFLARRFQDLMGLANQMIAKKADEVIFMQSGIPITIKNAK